MKEFEAGVEAVYLELCAWAAQARRNSDFKTFEYAACICFDLMKNFSDKLNKLTNKDVSDFIFEKLNNLPNFSSSSVVVQPGYVMLPKSREEASAMILLGESYLANNK